MSLFLTSGCDSSCRKTVKINVKDNSKLGIDSFYVVSSFYHSKKERAAIKKYNQDEDNFYFVDMSKINYEGDFKIGFWCKSQKIEQVKYFGYFTNGCVNYKEADLQITDKLVLFKPK